MNNKNIKIVDIILNKDISISDCNGRKIKLYDKNNCFQEIEIKSIEELMPFLNTQKTYSFRGQSCKDWKLKTTIERFFENRKIIISKKDIEKKILEKYFSESSIFSKELGYDPKTQNKLDALADIQHYGGPTRRFCCKK